MVLTELMFGMIVAAVVLLLLPFLLVMAGVGVAVLLWLIGTAALLGGLLFWLTFPDASGFAILMMLLVVGLLFVDRQARRRAP